MSSKIEQLRKKYAEMQKQRFCPFLEDYGEKYPCNKPESQCNGEDCNIYLQVIEVGSYP